MSISITKQPQEFNLAVGKNIWTLSGATQSNQLYLAAVRVNGATVSVIESPRNPASVAHFDLSNILKSKLAPEKIETIDEFANASSMILDYRINYGNKIGLSQSYTNLSSVKYVLNGWKYENIIDWDYSDFVPFSVVYDTCDNLNDRIRFSRKYKCLSNYPTNNNYEYEYKIFDNEYQTQTIFNVISQSNEVIQNDAINIAPSFVKWTFYDESNNVLKTHILAINQLNGAGPWDDECTIGAQSTLERILHIPSGTQNLKDAGIYPTGITASLVKRYKIGLFTRDVCENCPPDFNGLILKVNTTLTSTNTSDSQSIRLPLIGNDYFIDWGDGTAVEYNLSNSTIGATNNHTYATAGTYSVKIGGGLQRIVYNNQSLRDRTKLVEIEQWGNINWTSFSSAFHGCTNMTLTATDVPNLSNVSTLAGMFRLCFNFNTNINNWDVSNITSMETMFQSAISFNQPLNNWDTSNVINMTSILSGATSFNQPLNNWDTSNVINMTSMFNGASSFNQDISGWDTSSATTMANMFLGATSFNQPLNNWDTSSVTAMSGMFFNATSFNQPLNNWDTSNVITMNSMFQNATSFNQPLNNWDTSNVITMNSMFQNATSFNQNISGWDTGNLLTAQRMFFNATSFNQNLNSWNVSQLQNAISMFQNATSFNQSLNSWNVSNVTNMRTMFGGATSFNGNISSWNVSSVTDASFMFHLAAAFNSDISAWDTSSITNMERMLSDTTAFNRDISNWNVSNVSNMRFLMPSSGFNGNLGTWALRTAGVDMTDAFSFNSMSVENYSRTLIGFANYVFSNSITPKLVILGAQNKKYNTTNYGGSPFNNAVDARNYLTGTALWTITDGGL